MEKKKVIRVCGDLKAHMDESSTSMFTFAVKADEIVNTRDEAPAPSEQQGALALEQAA